MTAQSAKRPASGTEADNRATLGLIIALARATQALEQALRSLLAQWRLGISEFAVLEVLYHQGILPLGEIRDRILVTGASTTYVVKKLEQRGLVRRKASSEDQRVVFGELTPRGRALIEQVFPLHVEQLRQLTAALSIPQKREATHLLRILGAKVRRATGERIPEDD